VLYIANTARLGSNHDHEPQHLLNVGLLLLLCPSLALASHYLGWAVRERQAARYVHIGGDPRVVEGLCGGQALRRVAFKKLEHHVLHGAVRLCPELVVLRNANAN
jgi:hypothetical protein